MVAGVAIAAMRGSLGAPAKAPVSPVTTLTDPLKNFVEAQEGKWIVDGNPYGAQCVVLVNRWCGVLGIEKFPGDAADFEFDWHPDCDWIANTPTNAPSPGDIVVWGKSAALRFGHVDVALRADARSLLGFDQNWPLGSSCHRQWHDYTGVKGWLHPRVLGRVPLASPW